MQGLENAIADLLPSVEHRHYFRHLHANFKLAGHTGKALKDMMWNITRASYVGRFHALMEELFAYDNSAFQWLVGKQPLNWSRSHFRSTSKCDMLCNNLCESFNASILHARNMPILTMLERIRVYLMDKMTTKREMAAKWNDDIGPKIKKIIEKAKEGSSSYIPTLVGNKLFEVRGVYGDQFVVDLESRTCPCRRWDLTGLPCLHAVSAI